MRNARKSYKYKISTLLACSALVFAGSQSAQAAGFFIQEQSVTGLGQAFAGVSASAENASTIFYNPAGLTQLTPGTHITAGIHGLLPSSDLTDNGSTATVGGTPTAITGSNDDPFGLLAVPNFYAAHSITPDLWVGLGVSSPYGLGNEYAEDFFGRFNSTESELTTIDIAPTVAYRVNDWLSLGGSVNIQYANADLEAAIPDPATGGTDPSREGFQELEGSDWSLGWTVGAFIEPTEDLDIGLNYRSSVRHTLDGSFTVVLPTGAGGTTIVEQAVADLDTADIASAGIGYDLNDQWRLLGQVNWYGWTLFDDITIVYDDPAGSFGESATIDQNYKNSYGVALGANYKYDDKWTFRGGVQYDETPTTEDRSTLTPDGDRYWVAAGVSYQYNDRLSFDLSGTHIMVEEETVNLTETEAGTGVSNTRANVDSNINILAVGLNYRF